MLRSLIVSKIHFGVKEVYNYKYLEKIESIEFISDRSG